MDLFGIHQLDDFFFHRLQKWACIEKKTKCDDFKICVRILLKHGHGKNKE